MKKIVINNIDKYISNFKEKEFELTSEIYSTGNEYSYSRIVTLMRDYITKIAGDDYFNHIHINETMSYKKVKRSSQRHLLKHKKPILRILPRIDFSHDREYLDNYVGGQKRLIRKLNSDESIFKDDVAHSYIGTRFKSMRVEFDITIRLSSKIAQMKLYEKLSIGMRSGYCTNLYADNKFKLPIELLMETYERVHHQKLNLSEEIDRQKLIKYFTKITEYPLTYEIDKSTQKMTFYFIMDDYYFHFDFRDKIDVGEGEQEGDTFTNYDLNFTTYITSPVPYLYYNFFRSYDNYKVDYRKTEVSENSDEIELEEYTIRKLPEEYNGKLLHRDPILQELDEDSYEFKFDDFKELFDIKDEVVECINLLHNSHINPVRLIDFIVLTHKGVHPFKYDWEAKKIIIDGLEDIDSLHLGIYIDTSQLNSILIEYKYYNIRE